MQTWARKSRIHFCLLGLSALLAAPGPSVAARPPTPPKFSNGISGQASLPFLVAALETAPAEPGAPLQTPEKKRKASFLAAAGLIVLSLLILASGLALLHAFRRR